MREVVTMWRHTKMPGAPGLSEDQKPGEATESERADA